MNWWTNLPSRFLNSPRIEKPILSLAASHRFGDLFHWRPLLQERLSEWCGIAAHIFHQQLVSGGRVHSIGTYGRMGPAMGTILATHSGWLLVLFWEFVHLSGNPGVGYFAGDADSRHEDGICCLFRRGSDSRGHASGDDVDCCAAHGARHFHPGMDGFQKGRIHQPGNTLHHSCHRIFWIV